ncbi:MAG: C4-dicarboxylate TRAP transporter substrate-binding protein [Pseudomonadota bacterium]
MKHSRIAVIGLAVILAVVFLAPAAVKVAEAKDFKLTIAAGHPAGAAVWINRLRDFFVPEVTKRAAAAGHKVEFNQAYGGAVAKIGFVLEAVESGTADMGLIGTVFEPTKLYMHNFCYYVPFGTSDVIQNTKLSLKLYEQIPWLSEMMEKNYNQKRLAIGTCASYDLLTKFPIRKIEDLKGHKITAAGPNLPWVECVGGVPVQGNLTEWYTGLQTGVYEGCMAFPDSFVGFKFFEQAKYYSAVGFGSVHVLVICMNLDVFKSLPPELQKIFLEVGSEYPMDLAQATVVKAKESLEIMKKAGVDMYEFPNEERAKWANLMPDFANQAVEKAKSMGIPEPDKILRTWVELQEQDGYKWPRKWVIK